MNNLNIEERIRDYLSSEAGFTQDEIESMFEFTVYISMAISMYAHRNQRREDGKPYYLHPFYVRKMYMEFTGIEEGDFFCIDRDLMEEYGIPFEGVQEVCIMHDVLEDTEVTLEEIREIYNEYGYRDYFNMYIERPLLLVTHDKNMNYDEYIDEVLKNRTASMVKMADMADNLNIMSLGKFEEKEENRAIGYIRYSKRINDKYHFIEGCREYLKAFNS